MKTMKSGIIMAIISILLLVILEYFLLLPLNLAFFGTALVVLIFALLIYVDLISIKVSKNKKLGRKGISKLDIGIPIVLVLVFLGFVLLNSTMFKSDRYRNMIGQVEEKDFSQEIDIIDLNQLPIVDQKLAQNLGDKKLGTYVGLGSQVTLGEFTKQNVNGELYWVAPLMHSGFFKWWNNKEGTPGYIMVSATNSKDVKLVDELNGNKIKIRYQPNAYFGTNLKRYIFANADKTIGYTDFSFELNDDGKPFWVVTKYNNSIGMGGEEVLGVSVIDAQTGDIKEYDMKNIPKWIDRVVPQEFVKDRIDWWGELVHGFFNFSKKDMLTSTDGMNLVYNEGECYYYTGITSVGADEAIVGFMLTNTRTMKATFYKVSGSTELAGMQSAEGKVQNLKYEATFPILINIENIPTYFMSLKDKKGLIKQYAMVSVEDYSIVGAGETIRDTKSNYVKTLRSKGDIKLEFTGEEKEITGTILRIGAFNLDGVTYYNFVLKEQPKTIFTVSAAISHKLPITKDGDKVKFKYNEGNGESTDVLEFDNLDF